MRNIVAVRINRSTLFLCFLLQTILIPEAGVRPHPNTDCKWLTAGRRKPLNKLERYGVKEVGTLYLKTTRLLILLSCLYRVIPKTVLLC